VKKVVFPLEVMPRVSLLAALFHAAVSLAVLLALIAITQFSLALDHRPAARAAAFGLPVPGAKVVPCLTWGFLRDVGQIISVVVTALMFLSPLFYPSSALPARAQWIVKVNPVAFPIEQTRELVIFHRLPDWFLLAIYTAVGLVVEGHPDLVPV
jgi:lipopolysaccharide transport system permease protein